MRIRGSRSVSLPVKVALFTVGVVTVSGCSSQKQVASGDAEALAGRARQVAAAWDGSTAAAAWRAGYYPMGEEVQLPRGGWRDQADRQAYEQGGFALRAKLPDTRPKNGRVTWTGGESLARPLVGADESYKALASGRVNGKSHLTVTGARLGEMTLVTSRGPATVSAWLFNIDGYASPLKRAAAVPSRFPRPPIGPARDIPGVPINRLVRISADGRSVTVVALRGVCDGGSNVDVLETNGSVVLSASANGRKHGSNCTKQARLQQVTVTLGRSLDSRVLLDGYTGQPVAYKGLRGLSPSGSR
ncbi:hypothetical protein GA0115256_135411 [Streptomyces sp. DconLS]|nr:hypothetical protein GA0115256_135411 [Streptomyces sp. DconLS]SCF98214.1 hypothetical protein GA0115258_12152 [Streptomyces sp. LamerLS-31b]